MPINPPVIANSKRPSQSEDVLRYLASVNGSLYYEVVMLNAAAKRCSMSLAAEEHNMAVESFLVHFRNVRVFLYPSEEPWTSPKNFDDVIAFDYTPDWTMSRDDWKECSPEETKRINKLLAHLSYSRPKLGHTWPFKDMVVGIKEGFRALINLLPDDRKDWFKGYI